MAGIVLYVHVAIEERKWRISDDGKKNKFEEFEVKLTLEKMLRNDFS